MAKQGDWVRIHSIILTPEQRQKFAQNLEEWEVE